MSQKTNVLCQNTDFHSTDHSVGNWRLNQTGATDILYIQHFRVFTLYITFASIEHFAHDSQTVLF